MPGAKRHENAGLTQARGLAGRRLTIIATMGDEVCATKCHRPHRNHLTESATYGAVSMKSAIQTTILGIGSYRSAGGRPRARWQAERHHCHHNNKSGMHEGHLRASERQVFASEICGARRDCRGRDHAGYRPHDPACWALRAYDWLTVRATIPRHLAQNDRYRPTPTASTFWAKNCP